MSGNEAAWRLPEDMGAAELLRKLAGDLLLGDAALYDYLGYGHEGFWGAEKGGVSICRTLESLADLVERELLLVELCGLLGIPPIGLIDVSKQDHHSKDASMSAYDLLPGEDRKAIAWVREHGGVDAVSRDFQDADNRRVELCASLDIDLETGWADAMVAMRRRLMPEGMEWPRFETGEPVRFGDVVSDGYETGRVYYVTFDTVNPVIIGFTDETPDQDPGTWLEVSVNDGERVKRPAPKVLDADGVEIRVGDTVYHVKDGSEMTVYGIEGEWLVVSVGGRVRHDIVTHRAPVLAADGRPLREGETAYKVGGDGTAYVFDGMSDNVDGLAMLHHDGNPYIGTGLRVDQLTHERPDSWERIEADCSKCCIEYCDEHGLLDAACNTAEGDASTRHCTDCGDSCEERMARDLVRRAKKLAGVKR